MDRLLGSWMLDCMDADAPRSPRATWVGFRKRADRVQTWTAADREHRGAAARTGGFGARALRAALDSSPLWGAGRVEDTINLMGHALRKALGVIAALQGRGRPRNSRAGSTGRSAAADRLQLKAALDMDWDDPRPTGQALSQGAGPAGSVKRSSLARRAATLRTATAGDGRQVRETRTWT